MKQLSRAVWAIGLWSCAAAWAADVPASGSGKLSLLAIQTSAWEVAGYRWTGSGVLPVTGVQWAASDSLGSVAFSGSFAFRSLDNASLNLVLDDWVLDVSSLTLSARVSGLAGTQTLRYDVFQGSALGGSALLPQAGGTAAFSVTGLKLTGSFAVALGAATGLDAGTISYIRSLPSGSLGVSVTAVPEPSSWVLAGLGLAAAAVASRGLRGCRRAAAARTTGTAGPAAR